MNNQKPIYSNRSFYKKYINLFVWLAIFAYLFMIIKNIFVKSYKYSLGSDEIIVLSIPQYAIANLQTITDYLNAISYGLFYEDHLNITINILSPLILFLTSDNSLQLPNGLLY